MPYTDDPVRDAMRHDAEREERLAQLPICADCGEPIQSDCYYDINGEAICPDCIENYKKWTEDFIG